MHAEFWHKTENKWNGLMVLSYKLKNLHFEIMFSSI